MRPSAPFADRRCTSTTAIMSYFKRGISYSMRRRDLIRRKHFVRPAKRVAAARRLSSGAQEQFGSEFTAVLRRVPNPRNFGPALDRETVDGAWFCFPLFLTDIRGWPRFQPILPRLTFPLVRSVGMPSEWSCAANARRALKNVEFPVIETHLSRRFIDA